MIISSRRVGPRLPATDQWHDLKPATVNGVTSDARESWTLVLVAIAGAGRPLARKRAGGALPLPSSVPSDRAAGNAENPTIGPVGNPTRGGRDRNTTPVRLINSFGPNGPAARPAPAQPGAGGGIGYVRCVRLWNPEAVHLLPADRSDHRVIDAELASSPITALLAGQ